MAVDKYVHFRSTANTWLLSIIIPGLHDVTTSNLYGAIAFLFKLSGNHIIK